MNSRDRVMTTFNHKEPDKVPIDLGGTTASSIGYPGYIKLREYLGLPPDPDFKLSHIHQGLVKLPEDLLQQYEIDFRTVFMKKSPRGFVAEKVSDDSFYDEDHILWKRATYDYYPVEPPLADASVEDLHKRHWPDPYDPFRTLGLKEEVTNLYETTEYAIIADIMCRGPYEQAVKLRGFENFLTDLSINTKFAFTLLDKITEEIIGLWDVYLKAVGNHVQVVCQGDDLGMQTGLMISPKMYRQFIKPCHKRIYDFIHSRTNAKLFMHSCGSIYEIIPDLIEIGVEVLNPLQRSASKMDIANLKKEFGKDICLWGGGLEINRIDQSTSPEWIDGEIKRSLDVLAEGGGYVFALTHNIQPVVLPEQVDQIFKSALKYRNYPRLGIEDALRIKV